MTGIIFLRIAAVPLYGTFFLKCLSFAEHQVVNLPLASLNTVFQHTAVTS